MVEIADALSLKLFVYNLPSLGNLIWIIGIVRYKFLNSLMTIELIICQMLQPYKLLIFMLQSLDF